MNATCGTCFHWTSLGGGSDGICRGGPPTADSKNRIENGIAAALWPVTDQDEGCGTHSPCIPQPDPSPPEPSE